MGYPFESWKLIQTADMLKDSQTVLSVSLYCPVILPPLHYEHIRQPLEILTPKGPSLENMHNITSEYNCSLTC